MLGLPKPRVSGAFYNCAIFAALPQRPAHTMRPAEAIQKNNAETNMAGVQVGVTMSVADVRSVSDAQALLAQLEREEVRL